MSLIPWKHKQQEKEGSELSPWHSLRSEMERLFEGFMREPFGGRDWPFAATGRWSPAVDVAENDEEVTVRAEVPGIEAKDLEVTISGNQLVLTGEKKESAEHSGKDYHRSEIRFGSFRRVLPLPEGVDTEHVDAQYANGVLTLKLKKLHTAPPKKIPIGTKG